MATGKYRIDPTWREHDSYGATVTAPDGRTWTNLALDTYEPEYSSWACREGMVPEADQKAILAQLREEAIDRRRKDACRWADDHGWMDVLCVAVDWRRAYLAAKEAPDDGEAKERLAVVEADLSEALAALKGEFPVDWKVQE